MCTCLDECLCKQYMHLCHKLHIIIHKKIYINILTSKTQCQVKVWLCLYKNAVPVTVSLQATDLHCVQLYNCLSSIRTQEHIYQQHIILLIARPDKNTFIWISNVIL